ncbi:g-protein coupled receptor [Holotrichia oblita]|nr:g-protein coupled receptor [Holotrichia oblita]
MADPTMQTFCCYHGNGSDVATKIVKEFNINGYNTVCLFSSALGILGAIYQILPRQQYVYNHRWISLTAARGRKIIIWLAVADLLASVGVFTRSSLWLSHKNILPDLQDDASVLFCAISSAWIQYFYTSTWIWTLCYTIDIKLVLSEKRSNSLYYHLAAWIIPAFFTTIGLSLLYIPDAQ